MRKGVSWQELLLQGQVEVQQHVKGVCVLCLTCCRKTTGALRGQAWSSPWGSSKVYNIPCKGWVGQKDKGDLQKANTLGHQVAYGDALMIEFLGNQTFTILGWPWGPVLQARGSSQQIAHS